MDPMQYPELAQYFEEVATQNSPYKSYNYYRQTSRPTFRYPWGIKRG